MPRKNNAKKSTRTKSWKDLHHRIYFSDKDQSEMVQWAKGTEFDLVKQVSLVLSDLWSFKISPMGEGETVYCTVQSKDPNDEWADHSFGFIWANSIGSVAAVCYVCLVMAERGDLYREVGMSMGDVLDFLS